MIEKMFIGTMLILFMIFGYEIGFSQGVDLGLKDLDRTDAYMKGYYNGRIENNPPQTPCYMGENPMNASNWTTYKR